MASVDGSVRLKGCRLCGDMFAPTTSQAYCVPCGGSSTGGNGGRRKLDRNLRFKYGLSLKEFEELSQSQGHACAACGLADFAPDAAAALRRLHVDHCHETGRVRALLCHSCNLALGLFKEDRDRIARFAAYVADEG